MSIDYVTMDVTLIDGLNYTFVCNVFGYWVEDVNVKWSLTEASSPANPREEIYLAQPVDINNVCIWHFFLLLGSTKIFELTADMMEHNNQTLTCEASNSAGVLKKVVNLYVEIGKMYFFVSM